VVPFGRPRVALATGPAGPARRNHVRDGRTLIGHPHTRRSVRYMNAGIRVANLINF